MGLRSVFRAAKAAPCVFASAIATIAMTSMALAAGSDPSPVFNGVTLNGLNGIVLGNGTSAATALTPGSGVTTALGAALGVAGGIGPVVRSNTELSALPSTYAPAITRLGYAANGDSPHVLFKTSASACSLFSGAGDGGSQVPTSDGKCWIAALNGGANVLAFGAKGDNSTNDATAFQNAINAAEAATVALVIPRQSGTAYVLGSQLTISTPIDIHSDAGAALRFNNTSSSGILFDFRGANFTGVNKFDLPALYSPNTQTNLQYPGWPTSWSPSSRAGNGVTFWGGSRYSVFIPYMLGWSNAILFQGTYDSTYGAQAPENVDLTMNASDLDGAGVTFDSGPANAGQVTAIAVNVNTLFAKYPVSFFTNHGSTAPIIETKVSINGQTFTNEAAGACVYMAGTLLNNSKIDENSCFAGYQSGASPTGTSTSLVDMYLAGDQSSNGQTADANAAYGYFGGSYNEITVGTALPLGSAGFGYGTVDSLAGSSIRVKDVGTLNKVLIKYLDQTADNAVALSTTQGEANYNGGVGGAALSKRVAVSAAVPTLAPGATAGFWLYHQLLSNWGGTVPRRFIAIEGNSNTLQTSGLSYGAFDNSGTNNREIGVVFKNNTASTITGATYYFWVEVMN